MDKDVIYIIYIYIYTTHIHTHIYTVEYYSDIKKNEVMLFETTYEWIQVIF